MTIAMGILGNAMGTHGKVKRTFMFLMHPRSVSSAERGTGS
jgi:hypothetical protein